MISLMVCRRAVMIGSLRALGLLTAVYVRRCLAVLIQALLAIEASHRPLLLRRRLLVGVIASGAAIFLLDRLLDAWHGPNVVETLLAFRKLLILLLDHHLLAHALGSSTDRISN